MTGSEHEEQASRAHEPTTMRLPGISGLEQIDTGAEAEVSLSKADQATVDALRAGTALLHGDGGVLSSHVSLFLEAIR